MDFTDGSRWITGTLSLRGSQLCTSVVVRGRGRRHGAGRDRAQSAHPGVLVDVPASNGMTRCRVPSRVHPSFRASRSGSRNSFRRPCKGKTLQLWDGDRFEFSVQQSVG